MPDVPVEQRLIRSSSEASVFPAWIAIRNSQQGLMFISIFLHWCQKWMQTPSVTEAQFHKPKKGRKKSAAAIAHQNKATEGVAWFLLPFLNKSVERRSPLITSVLINGGGTESQMTKAGIIACEAQNLLEYKYFSLSTPPPSNFILLHLLPPFPDVLADPMPLSSGASSRPLCPAGSCTICCPALPVELIFHRWLLLPFFLLTNRSWMEVFKRFKCFSWKLLMLTVQHVLWLFFSCSLLCSCFQQDNRLRDSGLRHHGERRKMSWTSRDEFLKLKPLSLNLCSPRGRPPRSSRSVPPVWSEWFSGHKIFDLKQKTFTKSSPTLEEFRKYVCHSSLRKKLWQIEIVNREFNGFFMHLFAARRCFRSCNAKMNETDPTSENQVGGQPGSSFLSSRTRMLT